jgi:hypothetical protein
MSFRASNSALWAGAAASLFSCALDSRPLAEASTSGAAGGNNRGKSAQGATLDAGSAAAAASRDQRATSVQDAGARVGVSEAAGKAGSYTPNALPRPERRARAVRVTLERAALAQQILATRPTRGAT